MSVSQRYVLYLTIFYLSDNLTVLAFIGITSFVRGLRRQELQTLLRNVVTSD